MVASAKIFRNIRASLTDYKYSSLSIVAQRSSLCQYLATEWWEREGCQCPIQKTVLLA